MVEMTTQESDTPSLLAWVSTLDTPVWVTDPDGNISYVNGRAEALLGRPAAECVGVPCHQVVGAEDATGCAFCGPRCLLTDLADDRQPLPPVELRLWRSDGSSTWVHVLPIAVRGPGGEGPWLVHCALNTDRAHRFEDYLARVALRTSSREPERDRTHGVGRVDRVDRTPRHTLTKREVEILRLLAEDSHVRDIAASLHISHTTVRNHVQHILKKLGVHSIAEAVAYHILVMD